MEMTEYYDSIGWEKFTECKCDKLYDEFDAQLVIRVKTEAPPEYNPVFEVTIKWKQGFGDNWYFETEDGKIFKPCDVEAYLFDFS